MDKIVEAWLDKQLLLRTLVFERLKDFVNRQIAVRNCETEGMVYDLEADIQDLCYNFAFISYEQLDALLKALKDRVKFED